MKYSINDSIGSSNTHGLMLLAVPGIGVVPFKGESIAPVAKVVDSKFEKNGKWSNTTWEVECSDGAFVFKHWQTRSAGYMFFPESADWEGAVSHFRASFPYGTDGTGITDEMIIRVIRAEFQNSAAKIDAIEAKWANKTNQIQELIEAQRELVNACETAMAYIKNEEQLEEAKRMTERAAHIRDAVSKAKGRKMSLTELKALITTV